MSKTKKKAVKKSQGINKEKDMEAKINRLSTETNRERINIKPNKNRKNKENDKVKGFITLTEKD